MSERLRTSSGEQTPEQLRPADQFRVDPHDYPILRRQTEMSDKWGDNEHHQLNIDTIASRYVTETAELIAKLDGTAVKGPRSSEPYAPKPDHVIYLDKSARPVSWFMGVFWDTFSKEPGPPPASFLNIDRDVWYNRVVPNVAYGGLVAGDDGKMRDVNLDDFYRHLDQQPPETFAGIRALFVPGGVDTEDPEEIMKMPTKLDGKNLMIIDEVSDTGATLEMAKTLLKRAIPELASVNGDYFWHQTPKRNEQGDLKQQTSTPVWYHRTETQGRGIGELNPPFFEQRHEEFQTPRTRAQKLGSFALSEFVDLSQEKGNASRQLMQDIKQLKQDYEAGKVLMRLVPHWSTARQLQWAKDLQTTRGVKFLPQDKAPRDPSTFANIAQEIDERPPEYIV